MFRCHYLFPFRASQPAWLCCPTEGLYRDRFSGRYSQRRAELDGPAMSAAHRDPRSENARTPEPAATNRPPGHRASSVYARGALLTATVSGTQPGPTSMLPGVQVGSADAAGQDVESGYAWSCLRHSHDPHPRRLTPVCSAVTLVPISPSSSLANARWTEASRSRYPHCPCEFNGAITVTAGGRRAAGQLREIRPRRAAR